jgi:hypothetical protein
MKRNKHTQQLHQTQLYKNQIDNNKRPLTPTYKRNKSFTPNHK